MSAVTLSQPNRLLFQETMITYRFQNQLKVAGILIFTDFPEFEKTHILNVYATLHKFAFREDVDCYRKEEVPILWDHNAIYFLQSEFQDWETKMETCGFNIQNFRTRDWAIAAFASTILNLKTRQVGEELMRHVNARVTRLWRIIPTAAFR